MPNAIEFNNIQILFAIMKKELKEIGLHPETIKALSPEQIERAIVMKEGKSKQKASDLPSVESIREHLKGIKL